MSAVGRWSEQQSWKAHENGCEQCRNAGTVYELCDSGYRIMWNIVWQETKREEREAA